MYVDYKSDQGNSELLLKVWLWQNSISGNQVNRAKLAKKCSSKISDVFSLRVKVSIALVAERVHCSIACICVLFGDGLKYMYVISSHIFTRISVGMLIKWLIRSDINDFFFIGLIICMYIHTYILHMNKFFIASFCCFLSNSAYVRYGNLDK